MPTSLKPMLELLEGRERSVYQDSEGFWTIGVGRLVDERKGGGLSEVEIDFLLENDIKEKTAAVIAALPWAVSLSEPRMAVLIGMAFQMGIGNAQAGKGLLGFRNTLQNIRDGHFANAAENMLRSRWATQTPSRAKRMARQMETGNWQ